MTVAPFIWLDENMSSWNTFFIWTGIVYCSGCFIMSMMLFIASLMSDCIHDVEHPAPPPNSAMAICVAVILWPSTLWNFAVDTIRGLSSQPPQKWSSSREAATASLDTYWYLLYRIKLLCRNILKRPVFTERFFLYQAVLFCWFFSYWSFCFWCRRLF